MQLVSATDPKKVYNLWIIGTIRYNAARRVIMLMWLDEQVYGSCVLKLQNAIFNMISSHYSKQGFVLFWLGLVFLALILESSSFHLGDGIENIVYFFAKRNCKCAKKVCLFGCILTTSFRICHLPFHAFQSMIGSFLSITLGQQPSMHDCFEYIAN